MWQIFKTMIVIRVWHFLNPCKYCKMSHKTFIEERLLVPDISGLHLFFSKVQFIQLDEKGTQTKSEKRRHRVTRNSATSTSGLKSPDPPHTKCLRWNTDLPNSHTTQYIETNGQFVIVDYIDPDNTKHGELPLSTSTPRNNSGETTDSNHNLLPRQRKPHEGSLEKIPIS